MGKRINEEKERALRDACRLSEAVRFATEKHAGQFRKGNTIPYIAHPLEVMSMLVDGLQWDETSARFYLEMKAMYKEVFVEGWID